MNCSYKVAIGVLLVAFVVCGQSQQHTYTGVIVNANCFQAAKVINRDSRGSLRKSILKHCRVNPGTTEFALLDDTGNFFKLDETGNSEVLSQMPTTIRKITVTVIGAVNREVLNVRSLSTGSANILASRIGP